MVERFLRPTSPDEAVRLRAQTGGQYLAGGTELNWGGAPAAGTLISLDGLALGFARQRDDAVLLGPTLTLQDVADSTLLESTGLGVLRQAASRIGNRSIRVLATVGGNIAANKSCSDLIPPLLVLDASLTLASGDGERDVELDAYVAAPAPEALITAVRVPLPGATVRVAHERFSRSANDLALINAAVAVQRERGRLKEARVALGGVAATVVRVAAAEAAVADAELTRGTDDLLDRFRAAVTANVHPIDDLRGSASFKLELAGELSRRALAACIE